MAGTLGGPLPRDPTNNQRVRRFMAWLQMMVNSLRAQGQIQQSGSNPVTFTIAETDQAILAAQIFGG